MVRPMRCGQEPTRIAANAIRASCVRSISRNRSAATVGVSGASGTRSILALAERRLLREAGHFSLDPRAFFHQKVRHRAAEAGVPDPMG
jgi:hypothetical protein